MKDQNKKIMSVPLHVWQGDAATFLKQIPATPKGVVDLVVTSPPYNIGKSYERKTSLDEYLAWQTSIIDLIVDRLKPGGSLCWQVGNYADNGRIIPLDYLFHPIFEKKGLILRNRIVWRFGHGLHSRTRFSGRYEVILWYTKGDAYTFNLDAVRVRPKYPGKRYYKGPNAGKLSAHPLGKNPEDVWDFEYDVWDIPNVKANHVEKTGHPCQFPVGLIERLIIALTNEGDLVFDPFAGVGSSGVAAVLHKRRFWGCELRPRYVSIARKRLEDTIAGKPRYRPHDRPIYDHTRSKLSHRPTK